MSNEYAMSSFNSNTEENEGMINPEAIGLFFDRARMNASDRKSIDHYR